MSSPVIITLQNAKDQLRITDTDSDEYLTSIVIPAAQAIIASYLNWGATWPYDGVTTPFPAHIVSATLLVLSSLYEDREGDNDPIGPAVASILMRDRDPCLQ
ncbi:head-tail connector protein [Burkholderia cenocepacia]|uniref:head-tail connector protein n=1 Tax=Burkholderia cenocepacia TaxID=95486 RepID=UPI0038CC0552